MKLYVVRGSKRDVSVVKNASWVNKMIDFDGPKF